MSTVMPDCRSDWLLKFLPAVQICNKESQFNAVSFCFTQNRVSYLFAAFAPPPLVKHAEALQVAQSRCCDGITVQGQSEQ